jgi:hypothetical protein
MAACTTTYFEAGRGWSARVTEHNAELLAKQAQLRRRMRTPEFHFARHIDNSRLVKAPDLFSLVMIYGLQHFYAIENSYRVESEKQTLNQLREENRQLRLSQAELTQPGRIDMMARQLGLAAPQPGQVVHASGNADASTPVLAQMTPPSAPPAQ